MFSAKDHQVRSMIRIYFWFREEVTDYFRIYSDIPLSYPPTFIPFFDALERVESFIEHFLQKVSASSQIWGKKIVVFTAFLGKSICWFKPKNVQGQNEMKIMRSLVRWKNISLIYTFYKKSSNNYFVVKLFFNTRIVPK